MAEWLWVRLPQDDLQMEPCLASSQPLLAVGVIAVLGVVGTGDELPPLFVGISTGPITGDDVVGVAPVGK